MLSFLFHSRTYIAFQPVSWLDSYFEYLQAESCCFVFKSNKTHCPSYTGVKRRCMYEFHCTF